MSLRKIIKKSYFNLIKMFWISLLLVVFIQRASSIQLDDVEYDKMPQIFTLDDYFRCLVHNGTYCYTIVDVFADPPNDLMKMIKEYSRQRVIHYNHSHLERGVCVTDTCRKYIGAKNLGSPSDLHEILTTCLNDSFWNEYELQASVSSPWCTNKEESETIKTDWSDWAVLLLIIAVLAVNVIGTILDNVLDEETKTHMSKGKKVFLCFSIVRNWEYLKRTEQHNERLQVLKGIHAIRTAGSFSVICGHAASLYMAFIGNPRDYERAFTKIHFMPLLNGGFIVHVFFVIASFLLVYNLEMAGEKQRLTWKTVPLIIVHRFFRMIPPLFLVVAFSATWMRHVGTGPLWGRIVMALSGQCRSYWWSHLLFINNYLFENQLCNLQTWHLAADTQLFFLALVVYLVVQGKVWLRNLMLLLMLLLGIIFPAFHVYWYDLDAAYIFQPEFIRFLYSGNFNLLNVYAHTNLACYAIGMYTGYKIIEWQRKGVSFDNDKKMFFILNSVGPIFFGMWYGLSCVQDVDTPLWVKMFVQATIRLIAGGCTAAIIIGIAMKINNFRSLLEWNGWVIFGKLSYSVFIIHLDLVNILLGLQIHLVDLHFLPQFVMQFGVIAVSYIIAVPFYLLVEAPLNPVLKLLTTPEKQANAQDSFLTEVLEAQRKRKEKNKVLPEKKISTSEESLLNISNQKLKTT